MSKAVAIKRKCADCAASSQVPQDCEVNDCPLHQWLTPVSGKQQGRGKLRVDSIRQYCLACMNGQQAEIALCSSYYCPLYWWRPGSRLQKRRAKFLDWINVKEHHNSFDAAQSLCDETCVLATKKLTIIFNQDRVEVVNG